MEKSIALSACIHFMLKTALTCLVFQGILMWRLCMPWTFWNLLIPTVDSTTRPHQGKQLPSQNNKLLSRVYLRTIYFQTCLQNPFSTLFANSELPNDTSCPILTSLPHWETHTLVQIFVFLLYSLLRCSQDSPMVISLWQWAVSKALLHSCLSRIGVKWDYILQGVLASNSWSC